MGVSGARGDGSESLWAGLSITRMAVYKSLVSPTWNAAVTQEGLRALCRMSE